MVFPKLFGDIQIHDLLNVDTNFYPTAKEIPDFSLVIRGWIIISNR